MEPDRLGANFAMHFAVCAASLIHLVYLHATTHQTIRSCVQEFSPLL